MNPKYHNNEHTQGAARNAEANAMGQSILGSQMANAMSALASAGGAGSLQGFPAQWVESSRYNQSVFLNRSTITIDQAENGHMVTINGKSYIAATLKDAGDLVVAQLTAARLEK